MGDLSVESLSRGVDTNTAGGNVTARGDFATAEGMIGFPFPRLPSRTGRSPVRSSTSCRPSRVPDNS